MHNLTQFFKGFNHKFKENYTCELYANATLDDKFYGFNNLYNIDKWVKPMLQDSKSLERLAFESEI